MTILHVFNVVLGIVLGTDDKIIHRHGLCLHEAYNFIVLYQSFLPIYKNNIHTSKLYSLYYHNEGFSACHFTNTVLS